MKCEFCNKEFSEPVMPIHFFNCAGRKEKIEAPIEPTNLNPEVFEVNIADIPIMNGSTLIEVEPQTEAPKETKSVNPRRR